MLARVARIQDQLTQSWAVLSTLTPADYSRFRVALGQSSGFQSWQYRQLEFRLGNKHEAMIRAHRSNPAAHALLERVLREPGLYDVVLRQMPRRGFAVPDERVEYVCRDDEVRPGRHKYRIVGHYLLGGEAEYAGS